MHSGTNYATILCMLLVLSACGQNSEETPPPKLFQEQREVLDKSKTVNDTVQKQDEEQRRAIEKQTQ
jgi:outer membrane lipoprotein-sorting protein